MGTDASTGIAPRLAGRTRSIQWLTAGLVATHLVLGIATEFTGSRLLRVAALAAAGLAFLAVVVGIVALLLSSGGSDRTASADEPSENG